MSGNYLCHYLCSGAVHSSYYYYIGKLLKINLLKGQVSPDAMCKEDRIYLEQITIFRPFIGDRMISTI